MNARPRSRGRISWVLVGFLASLIPPAVSWAHADPSKITTLQFSLDDSVYVQGQAILALVCVRNEGPDTLRDLAPMDPIYGFLGFRLRDRGSGRILRRVGTLLSFGMAAEGLSLPSHGVACQVVDLLLHYGESPPREEFLNRARCEFSLPPGSYEVSCVYSVRSGFNRHLTAFRVEGPTVRFRVVPRSHSDSGERLLALLRSGASWTANRIDRQDQDQCRLRLSEAVRTPYAYQVFECAVPILQDSEIDSVLAQMGEAGTSPVRSGAGLWLACQWHRIPMAGGVAWLQARRASARSEAERDILETWERRLARRR